MPHPAAIVAFFILWAPLELRELRIQRRATLALDDQVREWVTTVARYAREKPAPRAVAYSGTIPGFGSWGVEGAVHYIYGNVNMPVQRIDQGGADLIQNDRAPLLVWKPGLHKLTIVEPNDVSTQASYISFDGTEPVPALVVGWYLLEDNFRWTAPHAVIRIHRPEGARSFSMRANCGSAATVQLSLDGHPLPPQRLDKAGWRTIQWPLPPAPAGFVLVTIDTSPPFHPAHDSRTLGLAIGALGFEQ